MSLYFWLDLLAISVPFLVSFHPRIRLYRHWKAMILALLLTLIPFITWDIYFTNKAFWGFNEHYLSGIDLLYLPIEEWLFFICIPYACVFTHVSILEINPRLVLSEKLTNRISLGLLLIFGLLFLFNFNKAYTAVVTIFGLVILGWVYVKNKDLLRSFYLTFLFMLIPFFIVNGILTGTGIEGNVVWYNDDQNLGIRLGTIPAEDTIYAFSLILMNLYLFDAFRKKTAKDPEPVNPDNSIRV